MSQSLPHVLDDERLETLVEEIGDRDLVRQAVQAFLDELPERLAAIRAAVAGGERDVIRSSAHALGSPAAMLGAQAIASTTRELQDAARADDGADLDALLAEVEASARLGDAALRDYLAAPLPA